MDLDAVADLNVSKLEHRFGGEFTKEKSQARHEQETKFKDTEKYKEIVSRLER